MKTVRLLAASLTLLATLVTPAQASGSDEGRLVLDSLTIDNATKGYVGACQYPIGASLEGKADVHAVGDFGTTYESESSACRYSLSDNDHGILDTQLDVMSSNIPFSQIHSVIGSEPFLEDRYGAYYLAGSNELSFRRSTAPGLSDAIAEVELAPVTLTSNPMFLFVNGEKISTPNTPLLHENLLYVPLRAVYEKLGGTVAWDEAAQSIVAEKDGTTLRLQLDSDNITKNGAPLNLRAAPFKVNDTTMVPVKVITEGTHATAEWLSQDNVLSLMNNGHENEATSNDGQNNYFAFTHQTDFGTPNALPQTKTANDVAVTMKSVTVRPDSTIFQLDITNNSDHPIRLVQRDSEMTTRLPNGKVSAREEFRTADQFTTDWDKPIEPGATRSGKVSTLPGVPSGTPSLILHLMVDKQFEWLEYADFNFNISLADAAEEPTPASTGTVTFNGQSAQYEYPVYTAPNTVTGDASGQASAVPSASDSTTSSDNSWHQGTPSPYGFGDPKATAGETPSTLPVSQTMDGVTVTVKSIEQTDETLFRISVENNSEHDIYLLSGLSEMIVGGTEIQNLGQHVDPNLQGSIPPGASQDGFIALPGTLGDNQTVQLKVKVYGNNSPFVFTIQR